MSPPNLQIHIEVRESIIMCNAKHGSQMHDKGIGSEHIMQSENGNMGIKEEVIYNP